MFAAKNELLTRPSGAAYEISRSLRFNSADSTYLNRTPATATNRRTWTWSGWVKRSALGADQALFGRSNSAGSVHTGFIFNSNDKIQFFSDNNGPYGLMDIYTAQVFRDVSAWYHLVFVLDTTQATASNRAKIYVNGVQVTSFSSAAYPNQNDEYQINTTNPHGLGRYFEFSGNYFLNGYMTEVNFIDGQALTPSSFGSTNAQTGVWQPKAYSGSYGTNGFELNFSDNSNTTAATLGKDSSGNGNNWTPNNFSVTAGAGNDSLVDVPTPYGTDTGVGGSVRSNYCTLNPLTTTTGTYTQGNLRYTGANQDKRSNGTISVSTGKWYWEVTLGNAPYSPRSFASQYNAFGFGLATAFNPTTSPNSSTDALVLEDSGYYKNFSAANTDSGTAFVSGDVLSVAVDLDANTFTFRRNNTSLVTGTIGGTAGRELVPTIYSYSGDYGVMDCNFGQRPFAYTAPSGFKALCTQNLPTPTIGATSATLAGKYFNPVLYTGNGSTLSVTGVGFQPDWVWAKCRGVVVSHRLVDAVRGVTKSLFSNLTDAETTESGLTAFNSDGFTVGSSTGMNYNTEPFVAWNWKANGSGSTNTAGSITSTVSANTTSGFSVVTYGANGTSGATVGHGLSATPTFVIIKNRSAVSHWRTGTSVTASAASPVTGYLSTTSSFAADSTAFQTLGSTTITLGNSGDVNSTSGGGYVAYCFTPIAGYSAIGSYTGNGSADGPFVFTGMRPAYVMIKRTDSTASWYVLDVARNTYNAANLLLYPNLSDAEATFSTLDILSNGFKIRNSDADLNASGGTYIYACFASNPLKYSLAR